MKSWIRKIGAAAAVALSAFGAMAGPLPGPLVDVSWLAENVDKVKVLEMRPDRESFTVAPEYVVNKKTGKKVLSEVGGHIPGSAWVDGSKIRVDVTVDGQKVRYMLPPKAEWERLAQSWGVNKGDAIVIASLGESVADLNEAARLYWQFKYYGEDNVAILNGGSVGWLAAEKPVSTTIDEPEPGNWTASAERREILATSEEVAAASEQGKSQLVDARPIAQYYGLNKSGAVTHFGHVANAKLAPQELLSRASGPASFYMDAQTYRNLFKELGISATEPTVTYCNTGHQASGFWFLMSEVLGNTQTKLYDGSLHQWTLEKRPLVGAVLAR